MQAPRVLIVPGLRDHAPQHWQTLLAQELPGAASVQPMGRAHLDCADRVQALEQAVAAMEARVLLVAHSAGCLTVVHWAARTRLAGRVQAALLATPPDFETPLPEGYPTLEQLHAAGWFPVPQARLPFPSLVATSDDDPLGARPRVEALAAAWGSSLRHLGRVGHLNPASGHGPWPLAHALLRDLAQAPAVLPSSHGAAPA